ncbi:hypothetical protein C8F01DRAFT_192284 [Mycena amicta]|nr:hypothetical protein C8F01DRAFT_192284 [Mycena amicta]
MAEADLRNMLHADPMLAIDAASRRRSRDSAAASTRSWVIMNAQSPPPPPEPIPIPEPVSTVRPLPEPPRRTASAMTGPEANAEHMVVDVPPPEAGYQWTTGRVSKAKEAHAHRVRSGDGKGQGFVGGFVNGLKRLPRAFGRKRPRRGTEATDFTSAGTEGTGNTLPQYRSEPPTPLVPDQGVTFGAPLARRTNPQGAAQPYHPSFILVPPEEDERPVEMDEGVAVDEGAMPGGFDEQAALSTHVRPPTPGPPITRTRSHLAPEERDGDEPVSVHANPLPTEDYRRMSAHDAVLSRQQSQRSRTTVDSQLGSPSVVSSPSFAEELHGPIYRFFSALHMLPWVATDRVTADWKPKRKPRSESEGISWYYPMGHAPPSTPRRAVSLLDSTEAASRSPRSGTGRRSADVRDIGREVHIRRHRSTRPRPSAGITTSEGQYGYTYAPYPAFSPLPPPVPAFSPPPPRPVHSPVPSPHHVLSPHRSHAHSHRRSPPSQTNGPIPPGITTTRRRHHRRPAPAPAPYHEHHAASHGVAHWGHMPVPMPVQMQISPQILPSAAPLYVIQATPIGSPAMSDVSAGAIPGVGVSDAGGTAGSDGANPHPTGQHANTHDHPRMRSPRSLQMLAPVYMQMQMPMSEGPSAGATASPNMQPMHASPNGAAYHYVNAYGYGYGSPVLQMQMSTPVSMPGS